MTKPGATISVQLDFATLEQLLSGEDIRLQLTQAVMANFTQRYLKPLLNSDAIKEATARMELVVEREVKAQIGEVRYGTMAVINPVLDKEIKTAIQHIRDEYTAEVEKAKQTAKIAVAEHIGEIENAVNLAVQQNMQILFNRVFEQSVQREVERRIQMTVAALKANERS